MASMYVKNLSEKGGLKLFLVSSQGICRVKVFWNEVLYFGRFDKLLRT